MTIPDVASPELPKWKFLQTDAGVWVHLSGDWTAEHAGAIEAAMDEIVSDADRHPSITADLSDVAHLDTSGAWLLDRTRHELASRGCKVTIAGANEDHRILLEEIDHYKLGNRHRPEVSPASETLVTIGISVVSFWREVLDGLVFLGEFICVLGRVLLKPKYFRAAAMVSQLDRIALHGVPIIALISILVGGIIAQQGIFQLRRFGADTFVVDLVGILTLRELGLLLAAIMVAGRSGSAFTAELGSMKMREEIDAIRVMGIDPMEVLIVPRILALVIALPLLTFLSDIAALTGGGLVSWLYNDMSPDVFMSRLKSTIELDTFLVGMIKAPFMALIIGLIASIEGFAVQGSAESLGKHVTSSVVKAIFMVIVADGIFAVFFAAIDY